MSKKNHRRVKVIAAFEFARYVYPPTTPPDRVSKMFAQVFRDAFLEQCYHARDTTPKFTNPFLVDVDTRLRTKARIEDPRTRSRMVRDIYDMCRALVAHGIAGIPVKWMYRPVDDHFFMSARPDLKMKDGSMIDLRLQPPNDYSRLHARITSWVFGEPIHLVSIVPDENGGYVIAREEVSGIHMSVADIPVSVGHEQRYPPADRIFNAAKPEVTEWYDGVVG